MHSILISLAAGLLFSIVAAAAEPPRFARAEVDPAAEINGAAAESPELSLLLDAEDQHRIGGPMIGFVASEQPGGIHSLIGVPGGAFVAKTALLQHQARTLVISSVGRFALSVRARDGALMVHPLSPDVDEIAGVEVDGARPDADFVTLSALGRAAALYHRKERIIELIAGLPTLPKITSTIDLGAVDGVLTALAVDDTGRYALAGLSDRNGGAIWSFTSDAPAQFLAAVVRPAYVAFAPNRLSWLAADYASDRVLWGNDARVAGEAIVLAGPADRVARPVAVESSVDTTRVLVLNQGASQALIIDRAGGETLRIDCRCRPSSLQRMSDPDSFQLLGEAGPTSMVVPLKPFAAPFEVALPAPLEGEPSRGNDTGAGRSRR